MRSLDRRAWVAGGGAVGLFFGVLTVVAIGSAIAPAPAGASGASPTAYVANFSGFNPGTVTPIDTGTNTPGSPITVNPASSEFPAGPVAVAVSPDGLRAYVADNVDGMSGAMVPIDTATNTVATGQVAMGCYPTAIAISPDGETAWVASGVCADVTPIDLVTGTVRPFIDLGSAYPSAIAITPDGNTAYVADEASNAVIPIDTATDTAGTPISIVGPPVALAVTPDGKTLYAADNGNDVTPITIATNTAGTPISVGSHPSAIAITPDGTTAYVTITAGNVTPIAIATNTVGTPISVGNFPDAIAITPDGTTAYVANEFGGTVTPIATATNTAGSAIAVGTDPDGMGITPDQGPQAQLSVTPAPSGSPTGFDASASVAPSSPITSYFWDFGDGHTTTTSIPTTSHIYSSPGTFTATVTETDAAGTSTTQVFTGQTVSRNGSPAAAVSSTFVVVDCTANSTCNASISTADQSVSVSGVSTTDTSVTLSDTLTSLSCGPKFDYLTTVSTLEESDFTSTSGLSVQVTQTHEATAKGVKICYQPAIPLPPPPVLLKKCSAHVPVPCYRSITEVSGSVVASFTVPPGDPRFWTGSGLLGLKTFSPTSGPPGTTVTIKGSSLGAVAAVAFGGHDSPVTNLTFSKSGTSLTVVVPSDAQSGAVRIYADNLVFASKKSKPFNVT